MSGTIMPVGNGPKCDGDCARLSEHVHHPRCELRLHDEQVCRLLGLLNISRQALRAAAGDLGRLAFAGSIGLEVRSAEELVSAQIEGLHDLRLRHDPYDGSPVTYLLDRDADRALVTP